MNELELSGRNKKINIAAWSLAIFVIVVGVVMMITTGERIFLLFIILGILTVVNVIFYDRLVLKPKLAKLRADREATEASAAQINGSEQPSAGHAGDTNQEKTI